MNDPKFELTNGNEYHPPFGISFHQAVLRAKLACIQHGLALVYLIFNDNEIVVHANSRVEDIYTIYCLKCQLDNLTKVAV